VTLPAIDPWLPQGFAWVLGVGQVFTVVIGFAVFASGLAARSLDHRPTPPKPQWVNRVATFVRMGVLTVITLSLLNCLPFTAQFDPRVPLPVKFSIDVISRVNGWLWSRLPDSLVIVNSPWLRPEQLLWTLMMVGVAILLVELAVWTQPGDQRPFDRIFADPRSILRFGWLVVALTCVCLVALPTLLFAGQALWHISLCASDWARSGLPH